VEGRVSEDGAGVGLSGEGNGQRLLRGYVPGTSQRHSIGL
jgi:hypothetical protein